MNKRDYRAGIGIVTICMAATAASAQTLTVLKRFNGTNGAIPLAPLVQGFDGNLYGTTQQGGLSQEGTIFKITPGGKLTSLYTFCATAGCADGSAPHGGLALDTNGTLYGTTETGGSGLYGTVFSISRTGSLATIYNFCTITNCPDGARPRAGLLRGADGIFYGTTYQGGSAGSGTAFAVTTSGSQTVLHSFCTAAGCTDGAFPESSLTQGADLNFYGIANSDGPHNFGSFFQVPAGGGLTTLYGFCAFAGCTDGGEPVSGVVLAADGNFYGTTAEGGTSASCELGCGTVFKVTPAGALTTLHSFDSSDGSFPVGLVQANDGNFYGTTEGGGSSNKGTIFQMTPSGTLTVLYSFRANDGAQPASAPVQGTDGNFYGTTSSGGTDNHGTVYKLSMGLGPFVKTVPLAGAAKSTVKILGTDLTGATSVTFNGVTAHFTIVSATEISATVPSRATSGPVQVTTPAGTLTSNPAFRVLP